MAYRKTYKTEIDAEVRRHLHSTSKKGPLFSDWDIFDWDSISKLREKTGLRLGTLRASLRRLCEAGLVHRAWDGNERFARYVYARRERGQVGILRSSDATS
jgi:DNA-binding transcriptional ArsR family regulator